MKSNYISLSLNDISLSTTPSKSIYDVTNGKNFILFMAHCIHVPLIFLIHSSIDGYLGCFHFLGIVNNAAMNIDMYIYSFILVFLVSSGIYSEVELLGHRAVPS